MTYGRDQTKGGHAGERGKERRRPVCEAKGLGVSAIARRPLPGWFHDYNTAHPHSGLRMLAAREFLLLSD